MLGQPSTLWWKTGHKVRLKASEAVWPAFGVAEFRSRSYSNRLTGNYNSFSHPCNEFFRKSNPIYQPSWRVVRIRGANRYFPRNQVIICLEEDFEPAWTGLHLKPLEVKALAKVKRLVAACIYSLESRGEFEKVFD